MNPPNIKQRRAIWECLQWATNFAIDSRDANESLDNPVFNSWVHDCERAIDDMQAGFGNNEEADPAEDALNAWWVDQWHRVGEERDIVAAALRKLIEVCEHMDENTEGLLSASNAMKEAIDVLVQIYPTPVADPAYSYEFRYAEDLGCWTVVQVFKTGVVSDPVAQTIDEMYAETLCRALNAEEQS